MPSFPGCFSGGLPAGKVQVLGVFSLLGVTLLVTLGSERGSSVPIRDIGGNSPLFLSPKKNGKLLDVYSLTRAERRLHKNPEDLSNRIRLAGHYLARGQFLRVEKILEPQQIQLKRGGQLFLAEAYENRGKYLDQIRIYKYLLGQRSGDFYVYFLMAKAYLKIQKLEEALSALKASVEANRKYLPAWKLWLQIVKDGQKKYEARLVLDDMIQIFGPQKKFISELCFLYYSDGFVQQALKMCKMGIQKNRRDPTNYVYLGLSLKNSGDTKGARKLLKRAGKRFPASELAQWAAAQMDVDTDNLLGAEAHLARALQSDPHSQRSHLLLAETQFQLGKYAQALSHFKKHCRLTGKVSPEFKLATGKLLKSHISFYRKYNNIIASCSRF